MAKSHARCTHCIYHKYKYAPYIKQRVEVCVCKGKCNWTPKKDKNDAEQEITDERGD